MSDVRYRKDFRYLNYVPNQDPGPGEVKDKIKYYGMCGAICTNCMLYWEFV
jgi:threonine dehydrogenase-like Zn-dependent dehydrogenase